MEKIANTDWSGFGWHVYHDTLLGYCRSYQERAKYIRTHKPEKEQELRLRLFQQVKGQLPKAVIKAGQAYDKAWQAYDKAGQAYDKAGQAYDKAWQAYDDKARQARDKAWKAYDKARQARDKAWKAYDKARQACDKAITDNMGAIMALHERECPNCPWNGITIFPRV